MRSSTISFFPAAQALKKVAIDVTPLIKGMIFFVAPTISLRYLLKYVAYGSLTRPTRKSGIILFIMFSLLTMALAATDCEILNSGISLISSTACCTKTTGIVCVNGRVTEMWEFSVFNTISLLNNRGGHLPLEIGNLTELIKIDIQKSDLSAGPVPDSIGLCTKLVKVRLYICMLQGEIPKGLRELKSLGILKLIR
jgi:hypothetical protein